MRTICTIIFIYSLLPVSQAQVDSVRLDKSYLKHYWTNTRDWVIAPVRWEGKDWLKVAAFAGTTIAITAIDQPVNDFFKTRQTDALTKLTTYGLEPLSNYYALVGVAGFMVHGTIAKNSRSQSTALMAMESFVISTLLVKIPKYAAGRIRPNAWWEPGPDEWMGPINGKSFPSGHATTAFAVASVIAYQYKDTPWVPVSAYSLATMAGISRVYDHRHWLSDIFGGAVFGIATGRLICKQHQKSQFLMEPVSLDGISGLKMVYRW